MSSLAYGMYGYSVLNVNGETDQLPVCRLMNQGNGAVSRTMYYLEVVEDDFSMSLMNGNGSWSAIRTPIAGLYEIEYSCAVVGQGAAGIASVTTYIDKTPAFDGSGVYSVNSNNSYAIGADLIFAQTGATTSCYFKKTLFLERDSYISMYIATGGGTAPQLASGPLHFFNVRCIAAENAQKASAQSY